MDGSESSGPVPGKFSGCIYIMIGKFQVGFSEIPAHRVRRAFSLMQLEKTIQDKFQVEHENTSTGLNLELINSRLHMGEFWMGYG